MLPSGTSRSSALTASVRRKAFDSWCVEMGLLIGFASPFGGLRRFRSAQALPVPRERGQHVVQLHAELLGVHYQSFEFAAQQAGARGGGWLGQRRGHHRPDAGKDLDQPASGQLHDHLVGGVGIDFEFLTEGADAGERVSGTKLAGDEGLGGRVDNLLGESDAGLKDQAERDQKCIITDSTARMSSGKVHWRWPGRACPAPTVGEGRTTAVSYGWKKIGVRCGWPGM